MSDRGTGTPPTGSLIEALEYELYVLRVFAAQADGKGGSAPGCPVEQTRKHLAARGIEPRVIEADLRKFDQGAG